MPTLSPSQKQALSGLAVAVLGAAGTAVEQALANPPFTWESLLKAAVVGALLGLVHRIPALGTAAKVDERAAEKVAALIDQGRL